MWFLRNKPKVSNRFTFFVSPNEFSTERREFWFYSALQTRIKEPKKRRIITDPKLLCQLGVNKFIECAKSSNALTCFGVTSFGFRSMT